ncbi:glycosyltransferase involved in cell wall biosynthesis [Leeuwenhoekiella aestuarii]|uniref:glycosyltransferase family 2 protein n=1 Tax=Leeuwenhoekiella aestuarii TaxID=2249426 RepID=UPI000FFECE1F|nr:glycosyltransferase [Leeuwenhoekiella aestuarii]RXG13766.1 glycosyltransferase involved in cell wall biosynthesis [Leeuwenhoekiella aestuarii]
MPIYNGESYLQEALNSVIMQSYENFELICVNDFSSDKTKDILEVNSKEDSRIKIINNSANLKLPASLNLGHKIAQGSYLTWTSHDNILKTNCLEVLLTELKEKDLDIIFSDYDIIDQEGDNVRYMKAGPIENLLFGNVVGCSFLYKHTSYKYLEPYDESLFLLEDYDFWLRASASFKMGHVNQNLYKYRIHNRSLSSTIQYNEDYSSEYENNLLKMFLSLAKLQDWPSNIAEFLASLSKANSRCFFFYWDNKTVILKTFRTYCNKSNQDFEMVKYFLIKRIREIILSKKELQNIPNLFRIIFRTPEILFGVNFSNKTTLNILIKCLKGNFV